MGRALSPGSTLSHYRVVSPLGAGGMGEVYLAQDVALERSVALKILPPDVVRNEERVSRFIQEAKAASALNHPNIVTIYEIGQAPAQDAEGEVVAGASIHYIAMELVTGDTLSHTIHRAKVDLRTLLGYLVQVAEGLAKAHSAGIVHRDLKPDNIMVSTDGYAKVLDFGLAKLTEQEDISAEETSLPTQTPVKTTAGVVMGTAGYMSPEQVQGKGVDHRSDIFSFGCILYEATTRKRPFEADSSIETMHKILAEKPPAVEDLNRDAPGELRRLIRRCLAKAPEQRLQSMKDLALDLREIVDEFDNLSSTSSPTAARTSGVAALTAAGGGRRTRLLLLAVVLAGLAGIGFGIYGVSHRAGGRATPAPAFQSMQLTRLTSTGNVFASTLSADGRYLAQLLRDQGRVSLWMKQVATGSQVQIIPPQDVNMGRLRFSPDGNYIYYTSVAQEAQLYQVLYQVPSLGGTPRKLLFDVDTAVTFSPDGKQVAFVRGYPQFGESALMVANADGSAERKLAVVKAPRALRTVDPSWSPDGRRIAICTEQGPQRGVVTVDAETGTESSLGGSIWSRLTSLAWLPDGSGVIVAGARLGGTIKLQIWQLAFPGAAVSRITNDTNAYAAVSVTGDGRSIATVQISFAANLWAVPATAAPAKQITFASSEEQFDSLALARDGTIVFTVAEDRFVQLYSMAADGSNRRQLTTGPWLIQDPCIAMDRDVVAFTGMRDGQTRHIWRMDLDGSNLAQVTAGAGEVLVDVDPSGEWALFTRTDSLRALWRTPLAGGTESLVTTPADNNFYIGLSPNGQRIAYGCFRNEGDRIVGDIAVIPVAGGAPLFRFPDPEGGFAHVWAPGSDAIDYVREVDGKWNIWRAPLDGSPPQRRTDFPDLQIFDFAWSLDGKQMVISRGNIRSDAVLISDFR